MQQGETIPLQVRALPNAPVSFSSFDLGRFQNHLTSITVEANDAGVATVQFTAPPGTINHVNILVASPMTAGQAKFVVEVLRPKPAGIQQAAAISTESVVEN